jgi:hypothetical protein
MLDHLCVSSTGKTTKTLKASDGLKTLVIKQAIKQALRYGLHCYTDAL